MQNIVQALSEIQQQADQLLLAMECGDDDLIEYRRQQLVDAQEHYFRICSRHLS